VKRPTSVPALNLFFPLTSVLVIRKLFHVH